MTEQARAPLSAAKPFNPDGARLSWSAFECFGYAGMAEMSPDERARLFELGLESGRAFLDAGKAGLVTDEILKSRVPIAFSGSASGPTTDFAIGRVYETASGFAFDKIVKQDHRGFTLAAEEWLMDAEARKVSAGSAYRAQNCELLR